MTGWQGVFYLIGVTVTAALAGAAVGFVAFHGLRIVRDARDTRHPEAAWHRFRDAMRRGAS